MIRWRNVFIALLVSAWAHGLAAAVLNSLGLASLSAFCGAVAALRLLGLVPVGCEASEQDENSLLERVHDAEAENRRLRNKLAERELKEPLS